MNFLKFGLIKNKLISYRAKTISYGTSARVFSTSKTKDLLDSIKEERELAEQNIAKKTEAGRKALNVTNELEYDKEGHFYHRKQNYEVFIDRILELYENDRVTKNYLDSTVNINRSLKEILGLQKQPPEFLFERLANAHRARGLSALPFSDFSMKEVEESTGMSLAMNQIEYNLLPGNFFPPHNITKVVAHMSEIRYKNTELVAKIREKMLAILNGTDKKYYEDKDIYAKLLGDLPNRRDNFAGFQDSKEFYSHVETLLNWKTEDEALTLAENEAASLQDESKNEVQEIVSLMKSIISSAKESKAIQKDMAEAIENVRSSYSQMTEAFDQNKYIQDNPYIKSYLLSLQTDMVDAGLMLPEEASGQLAYEEQSLKDKMRRANEVLYDLTLDYYPEMAPLTDPLLGSFTAPSEKSGQTLAQKEAQNELNLKYIGMILGKLSELRQSIRRDPVPINEYFTEKCYPKENANDPWAKKNDPEIEHVSKYYTSMWNEVTKTFNAMFPEIRKQLNSNEVIPLHHLLCLSYGMAQGEVIDPKLTKMIQTKMAESVRNGEFLLDQNDMIYGIQGLANSTIDSEVQLEVSNAILPQIDQIDITQFNLNHKLRLAWGLSVLERFDSKVLKDLVEDLDFMPFEHAQNELSFEEFQMLRDIYLALEHLNTDPNLKIKNRSIRSLVARSQDILKEYPEAHTKIDPFKPKLLDGLTKCLSKLGSDCIENAESLRFQTEGEAGKLNKHLYPYKPDLLFRHRKDTIALWLTNRSKYQAVPGQENMNLKGTPYTGAHLFHQKILRKLNPDRNIRNVYVCVEDMVDYNLANLHASVNYDSLKELKFLQDANNDLSMEDLISLSNWVSQKKVDKSGLGVFKKSDHVKDSFMDLLHEFFETRQSQRSRFLNTNSHDSNNLKAILMKLKLTWDSMTTQMQSEINEFVQKKGHSDFSGLLLKLKDTIDEEMQLLQNEIAPQLDKSWIGVRFGVEIPNTMSKAQNDTKNIGTEILNRKFMWCDDYFHYDDWAETMKETYDGFNVWVQAPKDINSDEKYFFQDGWKRVPTGIFPDGKGARKLSLPNVKDPFKEAFLPKLDLIKHRNFRGEIAEYHSKKPMIVEEILRDRSPVTPDIRMMTNLQNIKNSLKKTHSDAELLSYISSFEFVDSLIDEHLKALDSSALSTSKSKAKFVPRNADNFRKF